MFLGLLLIGTILALLIGCGARRRKFFGSAPVVMQAFLPFRNWAYSCFRVCTNSFPCDRVDWIGRYRDFGSSGKFPLRQDLLTSGNRLFPVLVLVYLLVLITFALSRTRPMLFLVRHKVFMEVILVQNYWSELLIFWRIIQLRVLG